MKRLSLLLLFASQAFAQHTFWRLNISVSNLPAVGQWVSYTSGGSVISTAGATVTATSCFGGCPGSFPATNVINGTTDCSTYWLANAAATPGSPQNLQIQFASPVAIDHIGVTAGCNRSSGQGRGPVNFELDFSDNGTTWTTQNDWLGVAWGSTGAGAGTRTILFNSANSFQPIVSAWRINGTGQTGYGFGPVVFYDLNHNIVPTVRFSGQATSTFNDETGASGPTDGNFIDYWNSLASATTAIWEYDFASSVSLSCLAITPGFNSGLNPPSNFTIQSSPDGSTWTTQATYTGISWSGQPKKFAVNGVCNSGPTGQLLIF